MAVYTLKLYPLSVKALPYICSKMLKTFVLQKVEGVPQYLNTEINLIVGLFVESDQ